MKKNLCMALIAVLLGFFSTGCEKNKNLSNNTLHLKPKIAKLYEQLPFVDYGHITLLDGDILRFENEFHFLNTYEKLCDMYESWSDLFFDKYGDLLEDSLDILIEQEEFDDNIPLIFFEKQYGFEGKNLRATCYKNEQKWLQEGAEDDAPIDEIVNCPIEQTLYSKYYEVCIDSIIYQKRPGGLIVKIPLSLIKNISLIRSASTIDELQKLDIFPLLKVDSPTDGCYHENYFKQGQQSHNEVGEKKFTWSYAYGKALILHRYKTTVTMNNYKKKNGTWKKDYATCALGANTTNYSFMKESQDCSPDIHDLISINNPQKFHQRSRVKYTRPVLTIPDTSVTMQIWMFVIHPKIELQEFHVDPATSYIQCRHQGWTYQYNAETGLGE